MTDFGRPSVNITAASRAASVGKLPKHVHAPRPDSKVFDDDADISELTNSDAAWPNPSPQSLKLAPMSYLFAKHFRGDWCRMELGFLNLILMPGTVVLKPGEKFAKLCLSSTLYGCWLCRCEVDREGKWLKLGLVAERSLEYVSLEDAKDWRVCTITVEARQLEEDGSAQLRPWPRFSGKATSALKHSALHGFRCLSVAQLKLLYDYLGVGEVQGGRRPATEVPLVTSLCEFVLGQAATPQTIEAALLARHSLGESSSETLLGATKLFDPHMDSVVGELFDDDPDIVQQMADLKMQKERRARASEQRMATLKRMKPPSGASSSSADKPARRFVAVEANGLSAGAAKAFCPSSASISKDDKRENRWRVRSKLLGSEKSKSYGRKSATTDWQAMVHVLTLAWRAHTLATGEGCPFDFEGLELEQ